MAPPRPLPCTCTKKPPGRQERQKIRCSRRIPGGEQSGGESTPDCPASQTAVRAHPVRDGGEVGGPAERDSDFRGAGGRGRVAAAGRGLHAGPATVARSPRSPGRVSSAPSTTANHGRTTKKPRGAKSVEASMLLAKSRGGTERWRWYTPHSCLSRGCMGPAGSAKRGGEGRCLRGRDGDPGARDDSSLGLPGPGCPPGALQAPDAKNPRGARSVEASMLLTRSRGGGTERRG